MRISLALFLFFLLFLSACEPRGTVDSPSLSGEPNTTKHAIPEFPIYDNFDDMEYIFEYTNDTTYVIRLCVWRCSKFQGT